MSGYILQTVILWTYRGLLCTCRFLWVCPYDAVKLSPRQRHVAEDKRRKGKCLMGYENKVTAPIPGSQDHMNALHKRLTKTEREIMLIKTRVACERASWEKRFAELHRQQAELRNQLAPEAGLLMKEDICYDRGVDNGDVFDECTSSFHQHRKSQTSSKMESCSYSALSNRASSSTLSSRPTSSLSSGSRYDYQRCSSGLIFLPKKFLFLMCAIMEIVSASCFCSTFTYGLAAGHRVRILLPSGRISTGTVRFLGHLQGEADLHLGVELQTPDPSLRDGSHMGHSYFECKPGFGAFVPFHKLLMAWE